MPRKQKIKDLLQKGTPKALQNETAKHHPSDVADVLQTLDGERLEHVVKILNHHVLGEVLSHLAPEAADSVLRYLDDEKIARVLSVMDADDAVDVLKATPEHRRNLYFHFMDEDVRTTLSSLIDYREETAGSIMTNEYIGLRQGMDVKEAMKALVANAKSTEGIQRLFVLDDNEFLVGVIELKTLIQARSPKSIDELMHTEVITVKEEDDVEDAARTMQNYGLYLLPVVNEQNQLKGVITMDDAADILDEETDEDYARFASISHEESVRASIWRSSLHRLPWLVLMLALGLLISGIIAQFEATLEAIVVLVFFQPLIMDMAGNTGTQSLAVTVRGISKDYYDNKAASLKHLFKELKVGFYSGIGIGVLSFFTSFLFLSVTGAGDYAPATIAAIVGLSLMLSLSLSSFIGAFIPLALYKLKADPAVASGPFITTIVDIIGLVIYFMLATILILSL